MPDERFLIVQLHELLTFFGFHRHLLKPVDMADLAATLQQLSRRQGAV